VKLNFDKPKYSAFYIVHETYVLYLANITKDKPVNKIRRFAGVLSQIASRQVGSILDNIYEIT
jgi:hypothetical protein